MALLTISKWELRKTRLGFGYKTLIFSAFLIILIGLLSFFTFQYGFHLHDGIYRVVVTDPDLAQVLRTDSKFQIYIAEEPEARALFEQGFDLLIIGNNISYLESEKSISALDALDKAVLRYDEARLLSYNDLNNTFPVWIKVKNIVREQSFQVPSIQKLPEFEATPGAPPEKTADSIPEAPIRETPVKRTYSPSIKEVIETRRTLPIEEQNLATPTHFNPPIPFKSVVLTFLFIFPMYFVAQLYSSSIMEERVRRKGELLLASPVKSYQIVFGKLFPYLIITLVLMAIVTAYIGGNAWMLIILLPVSLVFLSTAFLGAILARSFKEFTYILVFLSVILSGFFIFPAMFASIHDISIISPMTLVVRLLEGGHVSLREYVFSTMPSYLVSILIFMFGIFIYREEDLFGQKLIRSKLLDSIQVFIERVPAPLFFLSISLLPLVLIVELMLIVLMFNFPIRFGIVTFLFLAAFIEELVKSVGIYTVFSRKIRRVTTWNALRYGILSGAGFFMGEKLLLLVVIAGIANSVFGSIIGVGLLLYPLLIHVTSTAVASLGMRCFGTGNYLFSVILASILHSAYNLYLVRGVLLG